MTTKKSAIWPALVASLPAILILALLVRAMLPDPTADMFRKAKRMEDAGQYELALRHYAVLLSSHSNSSYAPQALEGTASILAQLGRPDGDVFKLRRAVETYKKLADIYPSSPLAGDALSSAGAIALTDIKDLALAKKLYAELLERYASSRDYAPEAMVKLGRIALMQSEGDTAQMWFQRVLQRYPKQTERCAEAQYHLGVAYETLWPDAQHKQWAKNAYEATFKRYPQSIYASDAKERLGLLYYTDSAGRPAARRVLIDVPATPPLDLKDDSGMLGALRLALGARGLNVGESTLRGWTLTPFYVGYTASDPGQIVKLPDAQWENIVATAGLKYAPLSGGDSAGALRDLQRELDMAQPPLIFNGRWNLAVGYDSSRGTVFLQNGARIETIAARELAASWSVRSPIGGAFGMIGFGARGSRPTLTTQTARIEARLQATPAPQSLDGSDTAPTPAPTATPLPGQDTPTFIYELKPLSLKLAQQRALKRAVLLMKRPQTGRTLLNLEALSQIARECQLLSRAPAVVPATEFAPPGFDDAPSRAQLPTPDEDLNALPGATPAPTATTQPATPLAMQRNNGRIARGLLEWFGGPLDNWITARRGAAAFCDQAANDLGSKSLQNAARQFRQAIVHLETSRAILPARSRLDDAQLDAATRRAFAQVAREMNAAFEAEKSATAAMNAAL